MNYAARLKNAEEKNIDGKSNYYGPNTKLIKNELLTGVLEGKIVYEAMQLPIPGQGRGIRNSLYILSSSIRALESILLEYIKCKT